MELKNYNILIVDDEIEYQRVLKFILEDLGYKVDTCSDGIEAIKFINKNIINLVLTDLKMPEMDGIELIKKIKKINEGIDIMVMTAFGSIETAVDAMKYGATDYYTKSEDMDELVTKVHRLSKLHRLENNNKVLIENQSESSFFLESKNKVFSEILEMCRRVADTDINILILGESGVGKEVIAKYIHNLSPRKMEPFVAVNCQVFPEGVIESELFGHEKGSFTGASEMRIGKFEQSNLGSLFLDEIGDLPISTQGKLLRAIESKKIERIGSNKEIDLDVRFISATNKDLFQLIEKNDFREDLFYRINTLVLNIPPIRDRKEDLPDLIDFFIDKVKKEQKKIDIRVNSEVKDELINYNYPGNIRELKNIIERMIALSKNGLVTKDELLIFNKCNKYEKNTTFKEAKAKFEQEYIIEKLRENLGNVAKTATVLEMSERQVWNKIKDYGINLDLIR